jgi:DNA replication protein DnaC
MQPLLNQNPLITVPNKKLIESLELIVKACETCSQKPGIKLDRGLCDICTVHIEAIRRYANANIPVRYWNLEMEKHFTGDKILLEKYKEVTGDLKKSYSSGISHCYAGAHGVGKTLMVSCILKRAVAKSYSAIYVTLSDIVNFLVGDGEQKSFIRRELVNVDFLVIDEFDPRFFMNSDKAADLFGKILEDIFRTRHQNCLPTFMATNSPNVVESFSGPIKQSISSLMNTVEIIPVLGKDFRIKIKESK